MKFPSLGCFERKLNDLLSSQKCSMKDASSEQAWSPNYSVNLGILPLF